MKFTLEEARRFSQPRYLIPSIFILVIYTLPMLAVIIHALVTRTFRESGVWVIAVWGGIATCVAVGEIMIFLNARKIVRDKKGVDCR